MFIKHKIFKKKKNENNCNILSLPSLKRLSLFSNVNIAFDEMVISSRNCPSNIDPSSFGNATLVEVFLSSISRRRRRLPNAL